MAASCIVTTKLTFVNGEVIFKLIASKVYKY